MAGQQELLALPPLMVLPPDQVTPQYLLEQLNTLVRHLNARFSSVEDTLQAVRIIQNNIVTMQPDRNILGMSDLFALPYVVIERAITDRMLDKTEPPAPAGITLTTGTVTSPTGVTVPWVEARWTGITASEEPLLSHYQVNFVIDGVPLVVKTRESVARLGDAPGAKTVSVTVFAVDLAGNVSPPSLTKSVTTPAGTGATPTPQAEPDTFTQRLVIRDDSGNVRVVIGRTGVGLADWGIQAFNAGGGLIFDVGGLGAGVVGANQIVAGSISSTHLRTDVAVITVAAQIANALIGTAHIVDLNVTTAKIADLAVTTLKLGNLAATTAKIADLGVTTAKIADLAVTNAKIGTAAISSAKIGNLEVKTANIEDLTVTTVKIANGSITSVATASTSGSISIPLGAPGTWTQIQTVTINGLLSVSTVKIVGNFLARLEYDSFNAKIEYRLLRGGSTLFTETIWDNPTFGVWNQLVSFTRTDTPGAGNFTYSIEMRSAQTGADVVSASQRTIDITNFNK